jgi:hypothetical protein
MPEACMWRETGGHCIVDTRPPVSVTIKPSQKHKVFSRYTMGTDIAQVSLVLHPALFVERMFFSSEEKNVSLHDEGEKK